MRYSSSSGFMSKENENTNLKDNHVHSCVHNGIIYNNQDMEKPVFINR